jgi:hypothetical protein
MKIGRRKRAPAQSLDDAKPVVEQPAPELQRSSSCVQPLAIAAAFSTDAEDTEAAAKLAAEVSNDEQVPELISTDASWHPQWSPKLDKSAIVDFVQGKLESSKFLITSAQSRHAALSKEVRASLYCAPLLLLSIAYLHKRRTQRCTRSASRSDDAPVHYKTTPTRTNSASSAASTSNCFSLLNQAATQAAAAEHTEHAELQASLLTPIAAPPRLRRACSQPNTVSPASELSQAAAAVLDDMQDVVPASAAAVSDDTSAAACTALEISAAQALQQLLAKSSSASTTAAAVAAALQSVSQRSIVFVPQAAFLGMGQLLSFKQCAAQALHVRGDDAAAITAPVLYVAAKPASKGKRAYA